MAPQFTVIIPTLNEEKFLPRLLNDLKKQKNKDFEVIVVDGNSNDNTSEVIKKFKDSLEIFFSKSSKRNVSYQRNLGANKAKGTYLIFLDADSRINGSFIKKLKQKTDKNKFLILMPSLTPEDEAYKIIFKSITFFVELSQTISKPFSTGGSMIIQKDFFNFIGGFNEKLYLSEDHELIQRARASGVIAKVLKDLHVKVSFRRMQKEGRLDIFRKYLIALIHTFTKGRIDKKIFPYEMGGAGYDFTKRRAKSIDKVINDYYKKFKKQLENFIGE